VRWALVSVLLMTLVWFELSSDIADGLCL